MFFIIKFLNPKGLYHVNLEKAIESRLKLFKNGSQLVDVFGYNYFYKNKKYYINLGSVLCFKSREMEVDKVCIRNLIINELIF